MKFNEQASLFICCYSIYILNKGYVMKGYNMNKEVTSYKN